MFLQEWRQPTACSEWRFPAVLAPECGEGLSLSLSLYPRVLSGGQINVIGVWLYGGNKACKSARKEWETCIMYGPVGNEHKAFIHTQAFRV